MKTNIVSRAFGNLRLESFDDYALTLLVKSCRGPNAGKKQIDFGC